MLLYNLDIPLVSPQLLSSGFTSDFRFYDYYIILVHVLPFPLYSIPPVSCSCCIIPCAYLCSPLGFRITTRLGSFIWLPWILMSRSWSLERVDSPSCWSERRSWSVDPQQTAQSSILPGPLWVSRVSLYKLVNTLFYLYLYISKSFILFIYVHFHVLSHLRISDIILL